MNTLSKNGFDLIKIAGTKVKGKFAKAFLGTLVTFAPLIALCFIPYAGWAISVFLFGVMETGYIRFMRGVLNGENPSLALIYSEVKTGWLETFLGVSMIVMFLLGTVLLIVPGVILICYYSMSLFMAEKYKAKTIGEALYLSQSKMSGNVTALLSYKSIFWLAYLILIVAGVLGGWGVVALFAKTPVVAVLVGVVGVLVFMILFAVITVYYHSSNATFFEEILTIDEQKKAKRANKTQNASASEVKENPVSEAPKTEKKPTETKRNTKKK